MESRDDVYAEYNIDLARIRIVKDPIFNYRYLVEFPPLSDVEKEIVSAIIARILESRRIPLRDEERLRKIVRKLAVVMLRKRAKKKNPSKEEVDKIVYYVLRDVIGYGKLDPLLKDPRVEDIHVLGHKKPVYIWYTELDFVPTNITFEDERDALVHIQKVLFRAGKYVSYTKPIVDGDIGPGYRVHVTHKAVSPEGMQVVIRKHRERPFSIIDLIRLKIGPPELFAYLWVLLENKRSILIIGETAAGKTTLLNAIATFIPYNMKIVVTEEVREINLPHPNVSYLITKESVDSIGRVTLFDLVKASMRQRPDYIIVGEIRGEEAKPLFHAINLGHGGLATMHAEDPVAALKRLTTEPMSVPLHMLTSPDTILHITKVRVKDKLIRYITEVVELTGIDTRDGQIRFSFNQVFRAYLRGPGEFQYDMRFENSAVFESLAERKGLNRQFFIDLWKKRTEFLRNLVEENPPLEELIRKLTLLYGEI